jgi:hypothetical protein
MASAIILVARRMCPVGGSRRNNFKIIEGHCRQHSTRERSLHEVEVSCLGQGHDFKIYLQLHSRWKKKIPYWEAYPKIVQFFFPSTLDTQDLPGSLTVSRVVALELRPPLLFLLFLWRYARPYQSGAGLINLTR